MRGYGRLDSEWFVGHSSIRFRAECLNWHNVQFGARTVRNRPRFMRPTGLRSAFQLLVWRDLLSMPFRHFSS